MAYFVVFLHMLLNIHLTGAEVFFPDAEARREHLLSLVDQVMEEKKAVSVGYTFASLCRFFSNRDASGLLGLPDSLPNVCLFFHSFFDAFTHSSIYYITPPLLLFGRLWQKDLKIKR